MMEASRSTGTRSATAWGSRWTFSTMPAGLSLRYHVALAQSLLFEICYSRNGFQLVDRVRHRRTNWRFYQRRDAHSGWSTPLNVNRSPGSFPRIGRYQALRRCARATSSIIRGAWEGFDGKCAWNVDFAAKILRCSVFAVNKSGNIYVRVAASDNRKPREGCRRIFGRTFSSSVSVCF